MSKSTTSTRIHCYFKCQWMHSEICFYYLSADKEANLRAAVVHLNFRAGSTSPVPVCTVSPGHWVIKADTQYIWLAGATRLTRSDFKLNLLLLKGQGCVQYDADYVKFICQRTSDGRQLYYECRGKTFQSTVISRKQWNKKTTL